MRGMHKSMHNIGHTQIAKLFSPRPRHKYPDICICVCSVRLGSMFRRIRDICKCLEFCFYLKFYDEVVLRRFSIFILSKLSSSAVSTLKNISHK